MSHRDHEGEFRPHGHKFQPQNWERLVSEDRRKLLDPALFLARFDIAPGSTVADLGAGPGFFTFPLADRVGPDGVVYATDVSADMLAVLAQRKPPPSVRMVLARETAVPLEDATVDFALLAFVLHELADPVASLVDIRRVLRPSGRLLVLEWKPIEEPIGPPLHERLDATASAELLRRGGFTVADQGEANRSQYFLLAGAAG